jgi:hypothetical protein
MTVRAIGPIKFYDPTPRESSLERWFVTLVRKLGGKAYKFVSPGHRSVPDRIVVFPCAHLFLVELKRKGRKPTPKQWGEILFWRKMGFDVYVCDDKPSCMAMLADQYVL